MSTIKKLTEQYYAAQDAYYEAQAKADAACKVLAQTSAAENAAWLALRSEGGAYKV